MIYIFDGYNVLYSKFKKQLDKFGFESTRNQLINFINSRVQNCIIVFDGKEEYPNPHIKNVVFTRNEKADDYIKRFVKNYKDKKQIVVITDDRSIRDYVKHCGANVMSVDEFFERDIKIKLSKEKSEKPNQLLANQITKQIIKEMGFN